MCETACEPLRTSSSSSEVIFDLDGKSARIEELEAATAEPDFWSDPERAKRLQKEKAALERVIGAWERQRASIDDAAVLLDLAEEENDDDSLQEASTLLRAVDKALEEMEIQRLLGGDESESDAIVHINAGAGGTEAQDWVAMLMRMYSMWAESRGYKVDVMDSLPGEEAGFKSVTLSISGLYAYGYLKAERGVHRLVRISPFDANARRHTSFASVAVYPDVEDTITIDIPDKDLHIDVYRSRGAGGQGVNTTDSAVRIRHIPTGIVVTCQNERSQLKNKHLAMKILKARLYERELEARRLEKEQSQDKKEIGFGSQIRSYVLQPYQMVKDHRTQHEAGNVSAVLDGALMPFIEAYLLHEANLADEDGKKAD